MAKSKTKKRPTQKNIPTISNDMSDIIIGIILVIISVLTFLSTQDVATNGNTPLVGQYLSDIGKTLFGSYYRIIFAPVLFGLGLMLVIKKTSWSLLKFLGLIGFYISTTSLIGWYSEKTVGFFDIFIFLEGVVGRASALIFFVAIFFVSLYLIFQISYKKIINKTYDRITEIANNMKEENFDDGEQPIKTPKIQNSKKENSNIKKPTFTRKPPPQMTTEEIPKTTEKQTEEKIEKKGNILGNIFGGKNDKKIPLHDGKSGEVIKTPNPQNKQILDTRWDYPSIQLLNHTKKSNTISAEEVQEKAMIIQNTLLQFGIEVKMEGECIGPTVIQYRLRPAEGVKISKIENLKKDLTLALSAKSIRIEAPIPGLGLIGIEVPNDKRDVVTIRELMESSAFSRQSSKLALALGKDISGDYIVGNLEKMPHLLIAGQTGSGKSVGMNGFIVSLLYKNSPFDLRMIMIDPKQVELGIYEKIPHLLQPNIITRPDEALNSLRWSVAEMERRLGVFSKVNAKNIAEYNAKVDEKEKMYRIVIVIDELADLMMSGNKKEMETMICRIAQKARATGMHLIIATQRPSVDVLTGLIKSNIPSRVAFTVASQVDSRTILDQAGAEDLLGWGDMLYFPTGAMAANRIQGVLVETEEIENIVRHLRLVINPETLGDDWWIKVTEDESSSNFDGSIGGGNLNEDPKVVENAILLVREAGKCSTSMLQRHLKLGYGRAARVVDILEEMGIVGPADGSKPRNVL